MGSFIYNILAGFIELINSLAPAPDWAGIVNALDFDQPVNILGVQASDPIVFIFQLFGRLNNFLPFDLFFVILTVYITLRVAVLTIKIIRRMVWN